MPTEQPSTLPTSFAAEQDADGSWLIRDVPIFSAHVDDRSGEAEEYDAAWLAAALANAQGREVEGYEAPLHVSHHDPYGRPSPEVAPAGTFTVRRLGTLVYEGRPTPTLFADLRVPDRVYQRIKGGELPYRSVELAPYASGKREILSLALLSHEVPYFRYSLLRIGDERSHPVAQQRAKEAATNPAAAAAGLAQIGSTYRLFRPGRPALSPSGGAAEVVTFGCDKPREERMDDKYMGDEPKPEDEAPAMTAGQKQDAMALAKILEALDGLAGMVKDLIGQVDEEPEAEEPEVEAPEDPAPAEQRAEVVAEEPAAAPANEAETVQRAATTADDAVRLALAEARLDLVQDAERSTEAAAIEEEARTFAAVAPERDVARFTALASAAGLDAARTFARAMADEYAARPLRPAAWSGEQDPPAPNLPAEILAYGEVGPEQRARLERHYKVWSAGRKVVPLARSLALNFGAPGAANN